MIFASSYRQLQPAEREFVDRYVSDLETAAVRAGERLSTMLGRPGAVDTTTHSRNFLERALVRAAISERVRELSEASEMSAHRAVKELHSLAFSSIGNYMTVGEDGMPYFDLSRCTPEQLAAIASIKYEEDMRSGKRKLEVKLYDKTANLAGYMRYLGINEADNWHFMQNNAKTVNAAPALSVDASDDDAANAYAKMIGG